MSSSDEDAIDLNIIEEYICQTLPTISTTIRNELMEALLDLGVDKPSDLEYVTASDLLNIPLELVQKRKFLEKWKEGKAILFTFLLSVIAF